MYRTDWSILKSYLREEYNTTPYTTVFVVQKHKASTTHFDFRIRRGEVLESWAIPKARIPSYDGESFLAVKTEDHHLKWLNWSGVIPRGKYGAGDVSIYDRGECTVYKWGNTIVAEFFGKYVKGYYSLVRTKGNNYLLLRMKQEAAKKKYERSNTLINANDMTHYKGIGAVVRNENTPEQILMMDHKKLNTWTLPVGKAGSNENEEEAIKRELKEEVGIDVTNMKLLAKERTTFYPNGKKINPTLYLFEITSWNGRVKNMEPDKHTSVEWMTIDEIRNLPSLSEMTHMYLKYLIETGDR